ncbi:cation diffusion facilitator family transporter [Stratiformator vulcanicus]|uniref:cation diffusion facilitator family transporter n=1 Tax=Stratiformator vulcanicus TaxID=2527980 RepID=UPI0011AABB7A
MPHNHSHSHDHGHGHSHAHAHAKDQSDLRLIVAVAVNLVLVLAQLIGGLIAGSLSLIADALHNFNDAGSLVIALVARRIARRPADSKRTFGYRRAEMIGALINLVTLMLVAIYLMYEAVMRFAAQEPIAGWIVVIVAGIALVVDVATALLTYAQSKDSLNIRAAFIHNVSDALASVAVIIAGTLILLYDWYWIDPLATLLISLYILWHGWEMLRQTIHILMDSVPADIELGDLVEAMQAVEHVRGVHHIHVWQQDEQHRALEAHVVIDESNLLTFEVTKQRLKSLLENDFRIQHSTLEFELASSDCPSTERIVGH